MAMKTCPSCGGSGKGTPSLVRDSSGWKNPVYPACGSCGGSGLVVDHGNTCFPGSTAILTPGGARRIDQIREGDLVLARNPRTGEIEAKVVLARHDHEIADIHVLALTGGSAIETTPNHSFRSNDRWVCADRLKAGDLLETISADGSAAMVAVERPLAYIRRDAVYNLVVADHFSFVANGSVVHSFTRARSLQCLAWTICALAAKTLLPVTRTLTFRATRTAGGIR